MPSTEITCPVCHEKLKSPKPVPAGATARCPKCRGSFQVPGAKPAAAETEAVKKPPAGRSGQRPVPKAEGVAPPPPPQRKRRGGGVFMIIGLVVFTVLGLGVLGAGAAAFFLLDIFNPASPVASSTVPAVHPTDKGPPRTEPVKATTKKDDTKVRPMATAPIPPMPMPMPPPPAEPIDPQVRDRVKQATVSLHWILPGEDRETLRTGFLAFEPDLILTSAQGINVNFGGVLPPLVDVHLHPGEADQMLVTATVIAKTADDGLFLLRVQRRDLAQKLPLPLALQPVSEVQPNHTVYAIGCLDGQKSEPLSVVPLTVSAINAGQPETPAQVRLLGSLKEATRGAPVVDGKGRVVGVATIVSKGAIALGGATLPAVVEAALKKTANMGDRPKGIGALRIFEGHQGAVFGVALPRDGKIAASCGADKTVRLWDVATGKVTKTLNGHTGEVHGVAISTDGKFILSGGFDKTVRMWDVGTGQQVGQLKPEVVGKIEFMGQVYGVAISADGALGVSGDDQSARLWDLKKGTQLHAAAEGHTAVTFAPDGKNTLIAGSTGLEVWKTDAKSDPKPIKMKGQAWVNGVAFTSDGKRVVSCQVAGEVSAISLWDVQAGKLIRDFEGENSGEFFSVALAPNDRLAVSGDEKGFVRVWDVDKGKEVARGVGHGGPVKSVAISADGKFILTGSEDGTLRLWPMPN